MCVRIKKNTHTHTQTVGRFCSCNVNSEYTITFYFAAVIHNSIHVRRNIVYNSYTVSKLSFCWKRTAKNCDFMSVLNNAETNATGHTPKEVSET